MLAASVLMAVVGSAPQFATDPGTWVRPSDYPSSALRSDTVGETAIDLHIGADGQPVRCDVTNASGSRILDDAACRSLMKRAKFEPATDEADEPIASVWSDKIVWDLADRKASSYYAVPPADLNFEIGEIPGDALSADVTIRRILKPDGTIESCAVELASDIPEIDSAACAIAERHLPTQPVLDGDGTAIRGMRTVSIRLSEKSPPS